jgi:hypothetical protein
MAKWNRCQIELPTGTVSGISPIVISASRMTDIPAFHCDWFFERMRAGYCTWKNPYNRQEQHISFSELSAIVFWSKNPEPLLNRLDELDGYKIPYYFHFTINAYPQDYASRIEPGVPPLKQRIETFRRLSQRLGKERVSWRFDPILLGGELTVDAVMNSIRQVGDQLSGFTERMVFSFADIHRYRAVSCRIGRLSLDNESLREPTHPEMNALAEQIRELTSTWNIQPAVCAEPHTFSVPRSRCVDSELLLRIAEPYPDCRQRLQALFTHWSTLKDTGQRYECLCAVSKDIGWSNSCQHNCVYCYGTK